MTRRERTRRMCWLVASIAAILGLVAILRGTEARLDAESTRNRGGRKPTGWVALDGVEYRPVREAWPADQGFGQTHRASVEACDPDSGRQLWKVTIREGTWPEGMGGMLDRPRLSHARFLDGFALKLAVREGKISVTSPDGAAYLVVPEIRLVIPVRSAYPPPRPPILDARHLWATWCEVHDQSLMEGVVPIRYGFGMVSPEAYEARRTRFPNAISFYFGGCVIGESREARVLYCPDCRDAEREWTRKPAPEPADDEG